MNKSFNLEILCLVAKIIFENKKKMFCNNNTIKK